ncbi:hypothetical protein REPUB_Repub16aG0009500 [Reevesia pubescens]
MWRARVGKEPKRSSSPGGGFSASKEHRFSNAFRKDATSFLFSNFPDGWTPEDLWKVFIRYTAGLGRLVDIYIPSRKDRRGGNFGFARFKEVKNENSLRKSLDSIWFGSYKLRVSVADTRIVKNGKDKTVANPSPILISPKRPHNPTISLFGNKNKTFKEALLGNLSSSVDSRRRDQTNLVFPVNEEDRCWLRNCAVGTLRDLDSMSRVQDFLWNFGLKCEIIPLGGYQVLIKGEDLELISDFIEAEHDRWSCWFHSIKLWEPLVVAQERFTWVRVIGLPLHAWNLEGFKLLGDLVGKFVAVDKATEKRLLMDKARLLVSVPLEVNVDLSINALVDGLCLPITIIEEACSVNRWWEEPVLEGEDSRSDNFSDCYGGNRSEESDELWAASSKPEDGDVEETPHGLVAQHEDGLCVSPNTNVGSHGPHGVVHKSLVAEINNLATHDAECSNNARESGRVGPAVSSPNLQFGPTANELDFGGCKLPPKARVLSSSGPDLTLSKPITKPSGSRLLGYSIGNGEEG